MAAEEIKGESMESITDLDDKMEVSGTSPLKNAQQPSGRSSSAANTSSGKVINRGSLLPPAIEYKLGDVVWAHVPCYPWWPAIVAPDPKGGEYTQPAPAVKGGRHSFHVLFFGPSPEHNWVNVRHMMPYTGKADYDKYIDDLKQRGSAEAKKMIKSIAIKSTQQAAWDTAVREIDEAVAESSTDARLEKWITVFFDKAEARRNSSRTPKKVESAEEEGTASVDAAKSAASKRKRKTGTPNKTEQEEPVEEPPVEPVKPPEPPAPPAATPAIPPPPPKPSRRPKKKTPLKTNSQGEENLIAMAQLPMDPLPEGDPETHPVDAFHLFIQRHLRAVALRYPTQSYCQLKTLLYNIWTKMTLNEKRKALVSPVDKPTQEPEKPSKGGKQNKEKEVQEVDEDADKPPLPAPLPPQVEEYKEALGSYQLEIYRLTSLWAVRNQPVCGICEKPGAELPENGTTTTATTTTTTTTAPTNNHLGSPPHPPPIQHTVDDELVPCTGQCCRHFHKRCLTKMYELFGLPPFSATEAITCAECNSGRRTCFSCKKQDLSQNAENSAEEYSEEDKQVILCSVKGCGRSFHRICATKMRLSRFENNTFTCPQHACATCAAAVEDPTSAESSRTGKMLRCVRCPVAYHVGDFCIAAGTQILGFGPNIVCGDHLEPTASLAMLSASTSLASKTASVSKPQHVTWCFTCGKSGPHSEDKQAAEAAPPALTQGPPEKPLICCATCPAAYHRRCLPAAQAASSDQRFTCTDCNAGKRPLYGDIVWVKVGHYRWWPCEIYHPENLPPNIRKMKHGTGEFAVRFFGTGEFFWLGRGRCFHFQHGDTSAAPTSGHGNLARLYNNSIVEATTAFDEWTRFKERQMGTQRERANCKPVPFKYIKCNYPFGDVEMPKMDLSEIPKCDCDINDASPCGADGTCVNRLTQVECHPQVCNAGEQCCNQRFVKRLYAPAEPFRTASRGWGLRALAPIKRGQFVVEYVGDLIDEDEHRKRVDEATRNGETNFYFLTLDRHRIIDAGPKGNLSRFMNHSCQPSCETQKWLVNGDLRVGLFALRDIAAGEELTFDYNCDESNEDAILLDKQPCKCGAPECRGLIGASKPSGSNGTKGAKEGGKAANKLSRRARQAQQLSAFRESHDDECFQCGEPGRLVLCDRPRCPKAYHVGCLGQDKPPNGRFVCPWHYCSVCWKPSTQLCAFCPHSYCAEHAKPEHIVERMSISMGPMWCCKGHDPNELNEALGYPPLGTAPEKSA